MTAKHAVIATGYEVARLLPDLPVRLHSSFALVSEPLPGTDRRYPDGLLFWDFDDPYLYGRFTDDERLLIGGKDETYRDPLRRRRALPAKTRALASVVPKRLPTIGPVEVAFSWSGTFAETPDGSHTSAVMPTHRGVTSRSASAGTASLTARSPRSTSRVESSMARIPMPAASSISHDPKSNPRPE